MLYKRKKKSSFILSALEGALIGATCIIPGASGGVVAISLGLYEPCVEAVYGLFRHFRTEGKKHFLFLLPLGIGAAAGLIGCSFVLEWLLQNLREPFMFALIGMVLGGLPSFFKEANKNGFKARYLLATAAGFLLIGAMVFASGKITGGAGMKLTSLSSTLGGAIVVAGTMIPGMSTSFFLMMLGIYEPLLSALTHLDMRVLVFVALGGVIGGGLMLIFIRKMFKRYHGYSYYMMLGFLLVTLIMVFPGISMERLAPDLLLFAAGFTGIYFMTKIEKIDPLTEKTIR